MSAVASPPAPPARFTWHPSEFARSVRKYVHRCAVKGQPWEQRFWSLYRKFKPQLRQHGYSLGKSLQDTWEICFWCESSQELPLPTVGDLERLCLGDALAAEEVAETDLPGLPDWIMEALRPFQRTHTRKLLAAQNLHRASLDGSGTGIGKMVIGCALAAALGKKAYVVAPLAVLPAWRRWLDEFALDYEVLNYEALRSRKGQAWLETTKVGRAKQYRWTLPRNALLILDEIQRACSPSTQTTRILCAAARQNIAIHCASATAAKDPSDCFFLGTLFKLHNGTGAGFTEWCKGFSTYLNSWGKLEFQGTPDDLGRLHRKMYPKFASRLRVQDLPPGSLPENNIEVCLVDTGHTKEIASAYLDADREAERVRQLGMSASETTAGVLAAMMKARIEAERLKLDYMIEDAKERMAEGYRVILSVSFRAHMQRAAEALGDPENLIIGNQKPEHRQQVIDNFQAHKTKWIVVGLDSGGVGISLHDILGEGPRYVLLSPGFSAVALLQMLGRAVRSGGKTPVFQKIILADGVGVEIQIANSLRGKVANLSLMVDSDLLGAGNEI